jgi:hypothetical protein
MPRTERVDRPRHRGSRFFKRGHPRTIDRYIDYFGGSAAAATSAGRGLLGLLDLVRDTCRRPVAVRVRSAS